VKDGHVRHSPISCLRPYIVAKFSDVNTFSKYVDQSMKFPFNYVQKQRSYTSFRMSGNRRNLKLNSCRHCGSRI
jgi:hypothetical protein